MDKKSVAATILVIFLTLTFSVIGVCFSVFVGEDTKIKIEKVSLTAASGIEIFSDKELSESADELKLSNMDTGLKPATGELDSETQIPSTITSDGTSEGYFATIYVKASSNFKIVVKNIEIETEKDEIEANEERKNLFISIEDIENTTKSLEEDETELATFENVSETLTLTFLIWLGSLSSGALEGSTITFTLDFVAI